MAADSHSTEKWEMARSTGGAAKDLAQQESQCLGTSYCNKQMGAIIL